MKGDLAMGFARLDPDVGDHAEALIDRLVVPHRDEQIVAWIPVADQAPNQPACPDCPYELAAHVDGCPDEATAVAVWGRS